MGDFLTYLKNKYYVNKGYLSTVADSSGGSAFLLRVENDAIKATFMELGISEKLEG